MYNPYNVYPGYTGMPQYYNNVPGSIQSNNISMPANNGNVLNGRVVNDVNEINVNDVPMTNAAYFPKSDKTEIYLKQWNGNGTISTAIYKLAAADQTEKNNTLQLNDILKNLQTDINEIKERLNITEKIKSDPKTTRSTEKGA